MTSSAVLDAAPRKADSRKPDQTRKKILKTAERLMWFQGYDGASLNDVVKKAGVSKGALFHYYPNKQAITLEILDKYAAEQLFAPFEKFMASESSLQKALYAWLQHVFDTYARTHFKGGCLLGNTTLGLSDREPEIRDKVKQIFLQWENLMVGHFKPAATRGDLLMEPRQCARLLIAQLQGAIMLSKAHKDHNRASREFRAIGEWIAVVTKP